MQVGGAYVRIRPYVADEDLRALEAFHELARDICAAFDRFHGATAPTGSGSPVLGEAVSPSLGESLSVPRGERHAA